MMTDPDIHKRAARWLARAQAPQATPEDLAALAAWRSADARHEAAYAEAQEVWDVLGKLDPVSVSPYPIDAEKTRGGDGRWRAFTARAPIAAALAASVVAVALAAILVLNPSPREAYETRTAEIRTVVLPDGSTVDIAPESRIEVAYSDSVRLVKLTRGEAFFDVRREESRQFIVETRSAEVQVLGTRFNVHNGAAGVTVVVAQGEVKVLGEPEHLLFLPSPKASPERLLSAGEQVKASLKGEFEQVVSVPTARAGAWRTGRLYFHDSPLAEVINDVNRYSRLPIVIASDELNELRVGAAFPTDNIDQTLNAIAGVFPVTIDRSDPRRIVIRPKTD